MTVEMPISRPDAWKVSSAVARFAGPRSKAWDVTDRATALESAGKDIIHLGVGDPDFDTPAALRNAAVAIQGAMADPGGGSGARRGGESSSDDESHNDERNSDE